MPIDRTINQQVVNALKARMKETGYTHKTSPSVFAVICRLGDGRTLSVPLDDGSTVELTEATVSAWTVWELIGELAPLQHAMITHSITQLSDQTFRAEFIADPLKYTLVCLALTSNHRISAADELFKETGIHPANTLTAHLEDPRVKDEMRCRARGASRSQ